MFDNRTGEVIERFNRHINIGCKLSAFIKKLTGITQEQVDNGVSINAAYEELKELLKRHKVIKAPVVWGSGDLVALNKEAGDWSLGRGELNMKAYYQGLADCLGKKVRGGLGKSMGQLGLQFKGHAHDALVDAENTKVLYNYLMQSTCAWIEMSNRYPFKGSEEL